VTLALADLLGSATLATVTLMGFTAGTAAGAVYTAESGPLGAMVPVDAVPPDKPFTLHVSCAEEFPSPEIAAVNS
jgi:hypothetical protein